MGSVVQDVPCPHIISEYSAFIGGVDLTDQAMCYYSYRQEDYEVVEEGILENDRPYDYQHLCYLCSKPCKFTGENTNSCEVLPVTRK